MPFKWESRRRLSSSPFVETEDPPKEIFKSPGVLRLTLPYDLDVPAELMEGASDPSIPLHIVAKLVFPKLGLRFRHCGLLTSLVAVPKTPVHEYRDLIFFEHDVRYPGNVAAMKSKT